MSDEAQPSLGGRRLATDAELAAAYDQLEAIPEESTAAAVERICSLADGGPVLELAAGTGRVAIPLSRRGPSVTASDISDEMLAVLRAKDDAGLVHCQTESMDADGPEEFAVVALLLNSIFVAGSASAQRATFRAAAGRLLPGGAFVLEHAVPDLLRREPVDHREAPGVSLFREVLGWAPMTQLLTLRVTRIVDGDRALTQVDDLRYVWPAELDLMAELCGLVLEERWAGWDRSSATDRSTMLVSVYRKPR